VTHAPFTRGREGQTQEFSQDLAAGRQAAIWLTAATFSSQGSRPKSRGQYLTDGPARAPSTALRNCWKFEGRSVEVVWARTDPKRLVGIG
jgi:hypothetical protein